MSAKLLRLSVVSLTAFLFVLLGAAVMTFVEYEERFHAVEIDRQETRFLHLKQSAQAQQLKTLALELRITTDALQVTRAELREAKASLATTQELQVTKEALTAAQKALVALGQKVHNKTAHSKKELAAMTERVENVSKQMRERDAIVKEALTAAKRAQEYGDEPQRNIVRYREVTPAVKAERLLSPTVQIICEKEVGSGTIIYSRRGATYVLTALHVIAHQAKDAPLIDVKVFSGSGEPISFSAELIASYEKIDAAIVRVKEKFFAHHIARLASRATLAKTHVFEQVYSIGCPLGYAPMPTAGELSSKAKKLKDQTYWMMNAPTIFGNSGGGIYRADTQELIGLLSRVSAYNNFINIAVPHMGIFVPMSEVYDWLGEEFLTYLYNPSVSQEECEKRKTMAVMMGEKKEERGGK